MSNALVDLVAIFSFVAHLGKKFIQVEYDSFLHLLFCKKDYRQFSFNKKQMNLLSTLLIQKGDLVLLLCHKIDQNEECTENHNSLKSVENEESSVLIDIVTTLEKPKESQVTADDLEEEKEKAELIMNDNLTVDDPPLFQLQSILCTESAKVFI